MKSLIGPSLAQTGLILETTDLKNLGPGLRKLQIRLS